MRHQRSLSGTRKNSESPDGTLHHPEAPSSSAHRIVLLRDARGGSSRRDPHDDDGHPLEDLQGKARDQSVVVAVVQQKRSGDNNSKKNDEGGRPRIGVEFATREPPAAWLSLATIAQQSITMRLPRLLPQTRFT